jgi:acetyl-CoA synthetase
MENDASGTWHPLPEQIAAANVTEIMALVGVEDYDALYRFSIERPADYWRAINRYCGIVWSRDYTDYVDLTRGKEFPRWFTGGKLNWTDTIFAWAKDPDTASRPALIAESEAGDVMTLTYAELFVRVRRFAAGLQQRGIGRGDRVGLLMEPGVEAVVSMLALAHIGAVTMPLFSGFGVDPIVTRLSSCGARALISTSGFRRRGKWINSSKTALEVRERTGIEFLILKLAPGEELAAGAIAWSDLAAAEPGAAEAAAMETDEPLMVFYTSGTTGKPKGTVHTHAGFPLKIAHDAVVHFDMRPGDVFFWPADMGWLAGALIIAATMMRGATMVAYDGAPDYPNWSRMAEMIERHRVTIFASAPTMIRGLAANAEASLKGDLSSLRLLATGGEAIDPDHFLWQQRHFGHGVAPLINYSGGTEASGGLVSSVIVKPIQAGGFNTASPGIDVDVVDLQGKPVVDEVGELAIRQPFVGMTRSFWEDDGRYLQTYWETVPGIWIHGDLAVRTRNGDFFVRGRSDDTLKLAGKRLGPAEVEEVMLELSGVSEAAAIGVDDPAKGQALVVFAIPSGEGRDDPELPAKIAQHVEARLGRAFRPNNVHVVTQLPKTRSSKVMRRLIRAVYCDQPLGDLSSLDNSTSLDEIARAAGRELASV